MELTQSSSLYVLEFENEANSPRSRLLRSYHLLRGHHLLPSSQGQVRLREQGAARQGRKESEIMGESARTCRGSRPTS